MVGDGNETFRLVTLDFLLDFGDPNLSQLNNLSNPNRVDLTDLDMDGNDDGVFSGAATFSEDGTEQDALAEYLNDNFNPDNGGTAFNEADTGPALDERIQNLAFREDTVLPDLPETIFDIAAANENFDILEAALLATGLDTVVSDAEAEFTVFAPTDAAFTLLAEDLGIDTTGLDEAGVTAAIVAALETLGGSPEAGAQLLTDILLYHVSPTAQSVAEVQAAGTITTALTDATFDVDGTTLEDNDTNITDPEFIDGLTDIPAVNGVIHAIDRVLLPIDVPSVPAAPVATGELGEITEFANFETFLDGGAEVVVHEGGLLYVTNGALGGIDVWDIASGTLFDFYDLTYLPAFDGVQSVAVSNGIVAAAVSTTDTTVDVFGTTTEQGRNGYIALIDAASGQVFDRVTVGNLPDMVTFSEDGTKILVANEGEFSGESDLDRDPIGSISIIDISNGALDPDETQVTFASLDGLEELARENGIRLPEYASLLRGLEPEYIAVEGNSAFVTLQEANAVAVIDIESGTLTDLFSLGTVDHSVEGNEIDANDDGESSTSAPTTTWSACGCQTPSTPSPSARPPT